MAIFTLTLNPAFDIHCRCDDFAQERENLAHITSCDPGGKGINISRALSQNEITNTAVVVLGKDNADDFCRLLPEEHLSLMSFSADGRIRENITVHPANGKETRLSFSGFSCNQSILPVIENAVSYRIKKGDIFTLTGRLPHGITTTDVIPFLQRLSQKGIRTVIDSRSFTVADMLACRPFLIKPNEEEIAVYLGQSDTPSTKAILTTANEWHKRGMENVIVSLGGRGALLVCNEGNFSAVPPKITPVSTVGAGDSFIAGFLAATEQGLSKPECLCTAVAFGTAACLSEGTNPPTATNISDMKSKITLQTI